MTEELKQKQDKKGRLLASRDYLYKYIDEQHPASTQELIDEIARQGYLGNRMAIKDDIDVLNKFWYGYYHKCLSWQFFLHGLQRI